LISPKHNCTLYNYPIMQFSKQAKLLAITLFLIAGTISTFGIIFLTQRINSKDQSQLHKAHIRKNSSIHICKHSLCSLAKLCASFSILLPENRILLHYKKEKNLIDHGSSSFQPWQILVHQCFSTWV